MPLTEKQIANLQGNDESIVKQKLEAIKYWTGLFEKTPARELKNRDWTMGRKRMIGNEYLPGTLDTLTALLKDQNSAVRGKTFSLITSLFSVPERVLNAQELDRNHAKISIKSTPQSHSSVYEHQQVTLEEVQESKLIPTLIEILTSEKVKEALDTLSNISDQAITTWRGLNADNKETFSYLFQVFTGYPEKLEEILAAADVIQDAVEAVELLTQMAMSNEVYAVEIVQHRGLEVVEDLYKRYVDKGNRSNLSNATFYAKGMLNLIIENAREPIIENAREPKNDSGHPFWKGKITEVHTELTSKPRSK